MASRQIPSPEQAKKLAALRTAATDERNIERRLAVEWETYKNERISEARSVLLQAVADCDAVGVTQENMAVLGLGIPKDRTRISRLIKEARAKVNRTIAADAKAPSERIYVYLEDGSLTVRLNGFTHPDVGASLPVEGTVRFDLNGMTEEEGPLQDDIVSQMNLWGLPIVQDVVNGVSHG